MRVEAVVLAGAANDGKLSAVSRVPYEALIPVRERPMVHYVLDALSKADLVKRIIVVGPVAELRASGVGDGVELVQSGGSMVDNLSIGVARVDSADPVLIVTADIPLIGPEAIDDFIRSCSAVPADIYYPIITQVASEARFPGAHRTYVRLKDGVYTGGNLALIRPEVVPACHTMISQAIAMRKNPLKLSRLLGFRFIIKLLLRRLTLGEIEERVRLILGFRGVGIVTVYPEIGIDIDKPEDLQLVDETLRHKN